LLALAALPLMLGSLMKNTEPELIWWTTHALEKIRPYEQPPKELSHEIAISSARNEFEPFQVVLRAAGADIDDIDVDVTDLRGPGNHLLSKSNVSIYLEKYLDLHSASSVEGGTGEWPDPLVPRVDRYAGERRNAFPFKILKGRNQPVWIDVYVPPGTAAGSYGGNVRVLLSGKPWRSVPLEVDVRAFELPSTSSLVTTFAFSGWPAAREHYGARAGGDTVEAITTLYQKAALWHRISLDGSSSLPPAVSLADNRVHIDWQKYDRQIGPFLDGAAIAQNEPLPGARLTSVVLRTPPMLKTADQQIQFWRDAAAHFRSKGWFDRMFNYLWDEPALSQFPAMIALGQTVRRADPKVRNLVTAPLHADWSSFIDIWTPVINCFEKKDGKDYCVQTVGRSAYDSELAKGKRLWWYQACGTHGCNILGSGYFTGWPGYMIDDAAIRNRIMEWLTWKYNIGGELYFNTNEAYFRKKDPWADVYLFGGNGDGTLFYPGTPDVIGGTTQIPIESIRLKLIREGLEDYEYMVLLAKLKGSQAVADIVSNVVHNAHDFEHDPKKLYDARERMARELED